VFCTFLGGLQWVLVIWLLTRWRGRQRSFYECSCCGYDLRGSLEVGRCPECGTPVGLHCQDRGR
jgi:hypothetical protein